MITCFTRLAARPSALGRQVSQPPTAQLTQNMTTVAAVEFDLGSHRGTNAWSYPAYAHRPCGYRLCASRADWSLGPSRAGNHSWSQRDLRAVFSVTSRSFEQPESTRNGLPGAAEAGRN